MPKKQRKFATAFKEPLNLHFVGNLKVNYQTSAWDGNFAALHQREQWLLPMQSPLAKPLQRTSNPTHPSRAFPKDYPQGKCFSSTLQFQYCFDCLTKRASKQNKRLFCLSYPPSPAQGDNLIQPHSQLSYEKIFALFCHINQATGVWYICNQFAEKAHLSLCLQSFISTFTSATANDKNQREDTALF